MVIESVVKMIVGQLKKEYFKQNTPVILALSLSTLPDLTPVISVFGSFEHMATLIVSELIHDAGFWVLPVVALLGIVLLRGVSKMG